MQAFKVKETFEYSPTVKRWGRLFSITHRLEFVANKNVKSVGYVTTNAITNAASLIYNNESYCDSTIYLFDGQCMNVQSKFGYFNLGHVNTLNGLLESYNSNTNVLQKTRTDSGTYVCTKVMTQGTPSYKMIRK